MCKELWTRKRDLIRATPNNSANYHKKYMKIKLNSYVDLHLKKALELRNMILAARSVFYDRKYYPQVLLNEF